ncbi:MAG: beta-ketoacyl-[acyl-carrier-protein] synthase family protein [Deltaproteobacteria bacterium]|nr:beta-ketoacyl-[acyl-carrier-protein] synthase family protein [Deltaproteobacteria bacterium]
MANRVFVTGVGVVSSLGYGREAFQRALLEGRSGISKVSGFDTSAIGREFAGQVHDFRARDWLTAAEARRAGRCSAFCIAGARMAIKDAGLDLQPSGGERTAVVLGTTMGEVALIEQLDRQWVASGANSVSDMDVSRYGTTLLPIHVARAVGARGMVLTLPAACAAGNYALGFASDLIRRGRADVVITGAAEIIGHVQYSGFARLGAMAPEHCQPFDLERQGLIVGEGAGIFVLESEAHAVRRGATPLAELGAYGIACDAYHITRPHPEGEGTLHALREAIRGSGLSPNDVDFVNAHGTATKANDVVEARTLNEIFGTRRVPVSSIKSMIGHCMGASSALEAASCIETVRTGWLPPTMHFTQRDPECDLEIVANVARQAAHDVVLNNSLAFGGYDAAVIFATPGKIPAEAPMLR